MAARVRLSAGALALELEPALGGCVASFRRDGVDLMRPLQAPPGEAEHALNSSMFPMAPFANSVRDNTFAFDGKRYELAPNMRGARLNYHGSGWQREWKVVSQDGARCRMVLPDTEETPEYVYSARQDFVLTADALEVTIEVTNRSRQRMPFGFGLHPWFPRHGNAIVRFASKQTLLEDESFQAVRLVPVTPEVDYSMGREPPRAYQNRCYDGWGGRASIEWPAIGVAVELSAAPIFQHLMFHTPAHDPDVFCLEPQSNRTSAFDDVATHALKSGVHILAPNEAVGGTIRFAVRASDN